MPRMFAIQEIGGPPRVLFAFFVPQRSAYWCGVEMQVEIAIGLVVTGRDRLFEPHRALLSKFPRGARRDRVLIAL